MAGDSKKRFVKWFGSSDYNQIVSEEQSAHCRDKADAYQVFPIKSTYFHMLHLVFAQGARHSAQGSELYSSFSASSIATTFSNGTLAWIL